MSLALLTVDVEGIWMRLLWLLVIAVNFARAAFLWGRANDESAK